MAGASSAIGHVGNEDRVPTTPSHGSSPNFSRKVSVPAGARLCAVAGDSAWPRRAAR